MTVYHPLPPEPELIIKSRGNLLVSINSETQFLVLAPQQLDTFPLEAFQKVMTEFQALEVYPPLRVYEIAWDKIMVVELLNDLLDLDFVLCHHNNPTVRKVFADSNIKLKLKSGRRKKYADPNERHRVHYYKKKREEEEQKAEIQRLKEELEKLKRDKKTP